MRPVKFPAFCALIKRLGQSVHLNLSFISGSQQRLQTSGLWHFIFWEFTFFTTECKSAERGQGVDLSEQLAVISNKILSESEIFFKINPFIQQLR